MARVKQARNLTAEHLKLVRDTALAMHAAGLKVFAIHLKRPACKTFVRGRRGAQNLWEPYQYRLARPKEMELMFCLGNGADGVGVVDGPNEFGPSTCVRDFDDPSGYQTWAAQYPHWARELPTVQTGRGYHVWCQLPAGHPGAFVKRPGGLDGELRASGKQYVAAPPSLHPNGSTYRWLNRSDEYDFNDLPVVDPVEAGFVTPAELEAKIKRPRRARTASPAECEEFEQVRARAVTQGLAPLTRAADRAVNLSLVPAVGDRHHQLFTLARRLKWLPEFADGPPDAAVGAYETWHRLSAANMRQTDIAANWGEFCHAWSEADTPYGASLEADSRRALAGEWEPQEAARFSPECRRVCKLVAHMQAWAVRRTGGDSAHFYLSCVKAGELLACSAKTAHKHLHRLVESALLVVVCPGKRSAWSEKASEYRWCGELPPVEVQEAVDVSQIPTLPFLLCCITRSRLPDSPHAVLTNSTAARTEGGRTSG